MKFKKDWCTFWFEGRWAHCCRRHDKAFNNQVGFFRANWRLFKCVVRRNKIVARVMMVGVSMFGWILYIKAKMKVKK